MRNLEQDEELETFESLLKHFNFGHQDIVTMNCTLKDVFTASGNKFGKNEYSSLVIAEIGSYKNMLLKALRESISSDIKKLEFDAVSESLNEVFRTEEMVDTLVFTFPSPRNEFYNQADFQELLRKVSEQMGEFTDKMGYYPITVTMPLLEMLQKFDLAILFMSLIFLMILALFVVISIILIYSLLMVSIQQKSFDIGIERLIGQTKFGIIVNVIAQTFVFVIPGFILAFFASFLILKILYYYEFEVRFGMKLSPHPTYSAIGRSLVLGIMIPIISAILPIREVLGKNLNDALDYTHSKTKAVIVKIVDPNTKNVGVSLIFGAISTIYAIAIYILLPQSLLALNFSLILQIFFLILIGLLLGLILIAMNLQFILEIFLTKLIFWWEKRGIQILIHKNLIAHRLRNNVTSIVYALSLSFIILQVCAYNLQFQNAKLLINRFLSSLEVRNDGGMDFYNMEYYLK